MAYLQAEKIFASDYNAFANAVNAITNAPVDLPGLPLVSSGELIFATTWRNLVDAVNEIAVYQSGQPIAGLSNADIGSGNTIVFLSTLSAGIAYISE